MFGTKRVLTPCVRLGLADSSTRKKCPATIFPPLELESILKSLSKKQKKPNLKPQCQCNLNIPEGTDPSSGRHKVCEAMKEPANDVIGTTLWPLSFVEAENNCNRVWRTHIWKSWTDVRNRGRREREKESERQGQHKATGGMRGLLAHSQFFPKNRTWRRTLHCGIMRN